MHVHIDIVVYNTDDKTDTYIARYYLDCYINYFNYAYMVTYVYRFIPAQLWA